MTEIKSNRAGSSNPTVRPSASMLPKRPGGVETDAATATAAGDGTPPSGVRASTINELVLLATVEARVPPTRQPDVMRVVRNFCEGLEPHVTSLLEVLPDLRPRIVFDLSCTANSLGAMPEPSRSAGAAADFDVRYTPEGSYTIDELEAVLGAAAEVYGAQLDALKTRLDSAHTPAAAPGGTGRVRPCVRVVIDLSRVVIEEEHVLEVTVVQELAAEVKRARPAPPPHLRHPMDGHAAP